MNIAIAFAAGFLTFFAGCLAPVAPVYVSFLAGSNKKGFLVNSLFFTAGFSGIFMLLGVTINTISRSVGMHQDIIRIISGIFLFIFGAAMLDVFHLKPVIGKMKFLNNKKGTPIGALILGITFSLAWVPCIGPVLGSILILVAGDGILSEALIFLLFFTIGLSTPFILIGLSFEYFFPKLKNFNKYAPYIRKTSGVLLIIFGFLFLTNNYAMVSTFLLSQLGSSAFIVEFQ